MKKLFLILLVLSGFTSYPQEDNDDDFDDDPIEISTVYINPIADPAPPNGNLFMFFSECVLPKIDSVTLKNSHEGYFEIQFVVCKNGSIEDVKILSSINPTLDKEIISIISKSIWQPGLMYNEPYDTPLILDYFFSLQN